jgi:hypothetical protein
MHTRDAHARKRHSHLYLGNFASNHGKRLISSILHRLQRSARQNSHHLVRITTHLFRIRHRQRKKIIQHRRIRRRVRWIHPTRRHAQAHFVRQHHPSAPTTPHSPRNHVHELHHIPSTNNLRRQPPHHGHGVRRAIQPNDHVSRRPRL